MTHTPDEPLPVRGRDNEDRTFAHPTAAELAERVRRLGSGGEEWIVVDRVPQMPHDVVQAASEREGAPLEVSFRIGDEPWREAVLDPDAAAEVFVAWARDEPGWEGDHPWVLAEWWRPEPAPEPDPAAAAEARELAATYLAEGYLPFDEVVRELHEQSEGDPPLTAAQAGAILAPMWRARVAEQAAWGTTDCDRLTAAFAELDRNGIVARERFTCCQNCGTFEIWEEAGPATRGYAFFHMQDAESAVDGSLYLSYGSRTDDADEAVAIGHEIVKTLAAHGLRPEWDGSVRTRVLITDLDWRKRLP
jgi:hypothetical protein